MPGSTTSTRAATIWEELSVTLRFERSSRSHQSLRSHQPIPIGAIQIPPRPAAQRTWSIHHPSNDALIFPPLCRWRGGRIIFRAYGDLIFSTQPAAQVDQLAALAAEREKTPLRAAVALFYIAMADGAL